jgi:hypothetical protein
MTSAANSSAAPEMNHSHALQPDVRASSANTRSIGSALRASTLQGSAPVGCVRDARLATVRRARAVARFLVGAATIRRAPIVGAGVVRHMGVLSAGAARGADSRHDQQHSKSKVPHRGLRWAVPCCFATIATRWRSPAPIRAKTPVPSLLRHRRLRWDAKRLSVTRGAPPLVARSPHLHRRTVRPPPRHRTARDGA